MCFSVKSSIISLSLGVGAAIFAFRTGQFELGAFTLTYSIMQISEMLIWRGLDTNKPNLNKLGTAVGKYTLPLHNVGLGIGVLLAVMYNKQRSPRLHDYIPLIMGALFYVYILTFKYSNNTNPLTFPRDETCQDKQCQNANNRLVWPYENNWYQYSVLLSAIISFYWLPLNTAILVTVFYGIVLAMVMQFTPVTPTIGSIWCVNTAATAPILVLLNYYMINKGKF